MIEVERRVLITKEKLNELKSYFEKEGEFVKDFKRFTMVNIENAAFTPDVNNPIDLRVRTTKDSAKLTVKYGNWQTDAGREEYEIEFNVNDFQPLLGVLKILNFKYFVVTYIHRYQYRYKGFDITLDEYHHRDECLMEVELGAETKEESDEADKKIVEFLDEMKLESLSKDGLLEFVQAINDIPELRIDLTKTTLDEWYAQWKDYIDCRV